MTLTPCFSNPLGSPLVHMTEPLVSDHEQDDSDAKEERVKYIYL